MASQVNAILEAVSIPTVTSTTSVSATPTPAPVTMIGLPTVVTFSVTTDLANERVQFGFLVYQNYTAAGGVTGIASITGTSAWVATPGISVNFPGVSVSGATATSIISGTSVTFTVDADVEYSQTTPGIYSVTVEP